MKENRVYFIIILLVSIFGMTGFSKEEINVNGLEDRDKIVTEVWDVNTEGPISSYSNNGEGIVWVKYYRGYADGDGDFYISSYNIPHNYSLIIKPGVTIHFTDKYGINVYGSLNAIGTEGSPITFTSNLSEPKKGSWGYIDQKGEESLLTMKHCVIEYGCVDARNDLIMENCIFHESFGASAGAVYGEKCEVVIRNCTFRSATDFNSLHGITASNAGSFVFENNVIEGNYSYLATQSDYFKLVGNQIRDDCLVMLKSTSSQVVEFKDNTIRDSSVFLWGNFTLSGCDIVNEKDWYFLNFDIEDCTKKMNNCIVDTEIIYYGASQKDTLDFRYNYWGTTDREEIMEIVQADEADVLFEPYMNKDMGIYEPGQDDEKGDIGTVIIVLIATVISVMIVTFFLLILIRKKRSRQVQYGQEDSYYEQVDPAYQKTADYSDCDEKVEAIIIDR
ncbi:MAG: right-handed parallel beta-helix repeat-containing protein [Candidatus Thermoplasmatota archaeon]|nr:right-handed parallel beta-helix repeat-containing protein [Candidatus Thermoplasmatota archaeon]